MTDAQENKERLMKRRSCVKGQLTVAKNYIDTIQQIRISKLSSQQIAELKIRFSRLENNLNNFDKLQSEIEMFFDDPSEQLLEREAIENCFFTLMSRIQAIVDEANTSGKRQSLDTSGNQLNAPLVDQCSGIGNIALPTIKLPSFDGGYNKWLEYRDTFMSLIHTNECINTVNKFHYLRSSLEGTAASIIESIEFCADNYDTAWDLLCDRYNNKRLLIKNHIKSLFGLEAMIKESDTSLRYIIDHISKNLRALKNLGQPVEYWDTLIIHLMSIKLDNLTNRHWEEHRGSLGEVPTLDEFVAFLRTRADFLESVKINCYKNLKNDGPVHFQTTRHDSKREFSYSCVLCKQSHRLYECPAFNSMNINERQQVVSNFKLCNNCLNKGHYAINCKQMPCKMCKLKHNTLLHKPVIYNSLNASNKNVTIAQIHNNDEFVAAISDAEEPVSLSTVAGVSNKHVLLSTALVHVRSKLDNKLYTARALLDSGSQLSMITEGLRTKLGLQCVINKTPMTVSGIGSVKLHLATSCTFKFSSLRSTFSAEINSIVVPRITNMLPCTKVDRGNFNIPVDVNSSLADPKFYEPSDVDILIGADLFWEIVNGDQIRLGFGMPVLQSSRLGWLVSGPVNVRESKGRQIIGNHKSSYHLSFSDINQQLEKFWEVEEISGRLVKVEEVEEEFCEVHFVKNAYRLQNGRFCVMVPFHTSPETLGDSLQIAKQRFYNLERRFRKQPHLKKLYKQFIDEYLELGHMSRSHIINDAYYLPHHPVLREKSETTKLRVVFDASAKTSSGKSLNDIQAVGGVIQDDLFSILVRFRQHSFVVTADIEKMYRQIMIDENQRQWQMIIWRSDEGTPLEYFKLNTVTYGTSSAPFLSTRCLLQLGQECSDRKIGNLIQHDFYVDDCVTGCESEDELNSNMQSIIQVLKKSGFNLRKFRTNSSLTAYNCKLSEDQTFLDTKGSVGTLGLMWSPASDQFNFPIALNSKEIITKREMLSTIAKIFDPLGLLSLITVKAKMLLQDLWKCKLDWDERIPNSMLESWSNFMKVINTMSQVTIPRHASCKDVLSVELHIFSDASKSAYGTCVYMRSVDIEGRIHVHLLCAKSRVSPLKTITIPRLELCAALLSAELGAKVNSALRCRVDRCVHWTDSTVVLCWLRNYSSSKLNVFVVNRINKISELTKGCQWKHVPTKDNPADLISRGVNHFDHKISRIWWKGPVFLGLDESFWPRESFENSQKIQIINSECNLCLTKTQPIKYNNVINFLRYSNFKKIIRVMAYILRFINNCKPGKIRQSTIDLNNSELDKGTIILVKLAQSESFHNDLLCLKLKQPVPKNSRILSLNPFLDPSGVIRVGGRIDNSNFFYDKKHPTLLDSKHPLSILLFEEEHRRLFHAGPQLLLASIRESYWVINGRNLARKTPHKCLTCRRMQGKTFNYLMGNLPRERLLPGIPFQTTGVDMAGPFLITDRKGRGCKITKCYLCVFICFATRAIHLEAVSDLSTSAFILALKRFIARRGRPMSIFCDNGSNFVGANNELQSYVSSNRDSIAQFSNSEGISFHFIPPYAPHFGGLWEAGVKSSKFHLKRVLGDRHLTFEELSTLFAQVEAILNSRPICPMSSDPNDLSPLTPGHFLIGAPLVSLPTPCLTDVKCSRLDRYGLMEQMRQHFWKRWSLEYVAELQQRTKWRQRSSSLEVDEMVLIKEENLPPLKWKIGRVRTVFPGADGTVRVADIMTKNGIVRRTVARLCPLLEMQDHGVKELKNSSSTGEDVRA